MRDLSAVSLVLAFHLLFGAACHAAQSPGGTGAQQAPSQVPPSTKMEAFKPAVGSVVTFGYDQLAASPIAIDVREMKDSRGGIVRGVVVEVTESQYRSERSFIDADEIPDLLKGIDAILAVNANPTPFANFEVRYTTKGDLQLTAFNAGKEIRFAVQAGRGVPARKIGLSAEAMQNLKNAFQVAAMKLKTLSN